jgi:hypothetical protein
MKKILSLVLVLSLVLGTFSFAFADGHLPEDIVGEDSEEAVATLMALGVVNGYPDGTYKPEKTVTRAEMTKLLVEALGYGELAEGATSTFADVQGTWAESYVGFATSMELVLGYPDGTFKPNQTMTMDEAMTMVIRALGYTDEVLKGSWPTNYKVKALDLGLTDGLSSLSGEAARGNVAILLFNALEVDTVEVYTNSQGLLTWRDTGKQLIDNIGDKSEPTEMTYELIYDEDQMLDTVIDLTPYLYQTITYYENGDGEVAYVASVDTNTLEGTVVATSETAITIDVEDADGDVTTFDVSGSALFLNGDKAASTMTAEQLDPNQAEVKVVYDDNDVVQGVIAWDYELTEATGTYSVRNELKLTRSSAYELPAMENADGDLILDEENLTVEGDVDSLEDIEKNDLLYYYASADESDEYPGKVKVLVVRDTFEGKYTKLVDSDTWVFGGVQLDKSVDAGTFTKTPVLGTEYKLVLDKDGDLYDVREAEGDVTVDEDYALYITKSNGTVETIESVSSVDTAPSVRLFTAGGDPVVYDLDLTGLTIGDSGDSITIGALNVDGDLVVTTNTAINYGDLVEYELNSDGELTSVTVSTTDSLNNIEYDSTEMVLDDSYDVTDNTVIFNYDGDWDDWTVEGEAFLTDGSDMEGSYIVDSTDWFVKVMVVTSGGGLTTDETYAVITEVTDVYDEDQEEAVKEITALVNGAEVTYLTEDASAADSIDDTYISTVAALTLSDGLVTVVTPKTDEADTFTTVSAIEGMKLRNQDGKLETVASDATVYILEDGEMTVGAFEDILEGDYVDLYDANSDGEWTIVVLDLDSL